jgi:hypothetical protein
MPPPTAAAASSVTAVTGAPRSHPRPLPTTGGFPESHRASNTPPHRTPPPVLASPPPCRPTSPVSLLGHGHARHKPLPPCSLVMKLPQTKYWKKSSKNKTSKGLNSFADQKLFQPVIAGHNRPGLLKLYHAPFVPQACRPWRRPNENVVAISSVHSRWTTYVRRARNKTPLGRKP